MPLQGDSRSFQAVSLSGAWPITSIYYKTSKGFFLLVLSTAPYAASGRQPIFSGCFSERPLADNEYLLQNKQGLFLACFVYGTLFLLCHIMEEQLQPPLTPPYQGGEQSFPPDSGGIKGG